MDARYFYLRLKRYWKAFEEKGKMEYFLEIKKCEESLHFLGESYKAIEEFEMSL